MKNKKTTVIMEQTGEKMEKTKHFFDNHGPLCFVHVFVESQLTLAYLASFTDRSYTHKSWGWGKKKKLTYALECKNHIWQNTEANHLHLYTYAHSFYCISCILLIICFLLYILQYILMWEIKDRHSLSHNNLPLTAEQMYHRWTSAQYRV